MMNCIIIDDEQMSRISLEKLCQKTAMFQVSQSFENPLEALGYLQMHPDTQVVFLDINMPELSGLEFMQALAKLPAIVLVSSQEDFAFKAFEYNVVDYLLKPVILPRFLKTVERLRQRIESVNRPSKHKEEDIFIKADTKLVRLRYNEILWIESRGDYVLFKTEKKSYLSHSTLKKVEDRLPAEVFLKVHRSYIVNLRQIVDIEDSTLVIADKVIPVSRSKKDDLIQKISLL